MGINLVLLPSSGGTKIQGPGEGMGKTGVPHRFPLKKNTEDRKCLKSCSFSGLLCNCSLCVPAYCFLLLSGKGLNCCPLDLADTEIRAYGICIPTKGLLNGPVWPMGISLSLNETRSCVLKRLQSVYCHPRKRQCLAKWGLGRQPLGCLFYHFLGGSDPTLLKMLGSQWLPTLREL